MSPISTPKQILSKQSTHLPIDDYRSEPLTFVNIENALKNKESNKKFQIDRDASNNNLLLQNNNKERLLQQSNKLIFNFNEKKLINVTPTESVASERRRSESYHIVVAPIDGKK